MTEFRIDRGKSALLLAGFSLLLAVLVAVTLLAWQVPALAAITFVLALLMAFVVFFLAVTLVTAPVMLRVTPEGLWSRRLKATIPWEALSAVRICTDPKHKGLVELVERPGGHPVFRAGRVGMAVTASELAKLPPLTVSFARKQGRPEDLIAAIRALGPPVSGLVDGH